MSIFNRPLSQLTSQDLDELIHRQAVENMRLEFKRDVPSKDETVKKLSSFANTFGGFVVVGAEANSKDGKIIGLPGVDPQPSYKQTVVQWCADAVTPFLDVDVSDPVATPAGNGRVCYVLFVRESDLAPHFLNDRKGVWIRTNEFSTRFEPRLANESELRHLLDRRKIVRDRRNELVQRARRRFQIFAERRYRELNRGRGDKIGSRFDLSIVPRFPAEPLCDHAKLLSIIKAKRLEWRGVGFPRDSIALASQHESAIVLRPGSSFSILEANIWGLLFYATEIEHREDTYSGIHLNHFLGQLLVFLKHAQLMKSELGYVGPLLIQMRLEAICGVPWVYFPGGGNKAEKGPASELDDEVSFAVNTDGEELDQRLEKLAVDILRYVFFALNWAEIADNDQKLEELVEAGKHFNWWAGSY